MKVIVAGAGIGGLAAALALHAVGAEVVVYEAATLPIAQPRIDRIPLSVLPRTELRLQTTLVLPPAWPMQRDEAVLARLAALDAALAREPPGEGLGPKSVLLQESPRSD